MSAHAGQVRLEYVQAARAGNITPCFVRAAKTWLFDNVARLIIMPSTMFVETPAKINLFFEVLGKRHDGFHEIVSVAVPIRLCDTLTFEMADASRIQFKCFGNDAVPSDDTNLVVKAVKFIQERYHVQKGVSITLHKRIPCQAGLGGGSSNAAAALRSVCRLWNLSVSDAELMSMAAELGSDCPLFFHDVPTLITGRGEQVQPLQSIPTLWFVLLKPPEGLSTAKVYAECMPRHDIRQPDELIAALSNGNVHEIGRHLFNRLEVPAQMIWPRFSAVKHQLLLSGCISGRMTGSGTAFFGLCEDEIHANEVFQRLRSISAPDDEVFLVRT